MGLRCAEGWGSPAGGKLLALPAGAPKPWGTATAPPKPREAAALPPMMSSKLRLGFRAAAAAGPVCERGIRTSMPDHTCTAAVLGEGLSRQAPPWNREMAVPPSVMTAKLLLRFWAAPTRVAVQSQDVGATSDLICRQINRQSSSVNTEQACIHLRHLHLQELQKQPPLAAG